MFEMMLVNGQVKPYTGKIGLYNLNYVPGPTTDELYLVGGVTEDETQNEALWLWNGKTDTTTNLGWLPKSIHRGGAGSMGTVGGDLYCISGDVIDIYRATSKRWEKRVGGTYGTHYHFMSNSSVTYGGYMYFFGPSSSPQGITLKRYDHVNNTWSTESTYKTTTNDGTYNRGIVRGTVAYFFGGSQLEKSVAKYNFTTKVWSTLTAPYAVQPRPALSMYATSILVTPVDAAGQPLWSSDGKIIMALDATDTFTQIAETNPPKLTAATVVVGNQLKAFGGQNKATGKPVAAMQSITVGPPADNGNTITLTGNIPITLATQPVRSVTTCNDNANKRIWIHRGITQNAAGWSTWIGYYDVVSNTWVPRYNWASSPLLTATMVLHENNLYIFGGTDNYKYYNPTNTLTKLAPMGGYTFTENNAPACVYNGEIYLLGNSVSGSTYYSELVKYDPVNNTRSSVSKQQIPFYPHGAAGAGILVGDWFCICGSTNSGGSQEAVLCHNLATGEFKNIKLRGSVIRKPGLVTDGKTFTILGSMAQGDGAVWNVDPNNGFNWNSGVIEPTKQQGAAMYDTGKVIYYGGGSAVSTGSNTVITFDYPA